MAVNFLVLDDGTILDGESFGYEGSAFGEVVFSTRMRGYQENLTDPSFRGHILIFTFPLIGNYGVKGDFKQSDHIHVRGIVVKEHCKKPSKMYGGMPIDTYLKDNGIPAISGIDTRELAVKIRQYGAFKGAIVNNKDDIPEAIKKTRSTSYSCTENLVKEVSVKKITDYNFKKDITVGIIDCGFKKDILESLGKRFNVKIFPYDTPAQAIIDSGVRGIVVSNGPGDPSHPNIMNTVVKSVNELSTMLPMMGICYGGQIIALSMGGKTYKMKFGHRGENHPVKFEGRVYTTSQNHGFTVNEKSLDGTGLMVNQVNINDGTVEGFIHKDLPIFACQYYPEASAGTSDTNFLFDKFRKLIQGEIA